MAQEYPVNMTASNVKKTLEINKNAIACAGVLRMDGAGTWGWINDANHGPINFGVTVTQNTAFVEIPFAPATTKLGGVVVGPDESFAGIFDCGGSIVNGPGGSARPPERPHGCRRQEGSVRRGNTIRLASGGAEAWVSKP